MKKSFFVASSLLAIFMCSSLLSEDLYIDRVKAHKNTIKEDSLYADIINHADNPFLTDRRAINAHETTHHLNSYNSTNNYAAFYLTGDMYTFVSRVKYPIIEVGKNIPLKLRGPRFKLYFVSQPQQPAIASDLLYIGDEWSAYLNDSEVILDDYRRGFLDFSERTNAAFAPLEFSVYSCYIGLTIKEKFPDVWPEYKQFLIYQLSRSYKVYYNLMVIDQFFWKEAVTYTENIKDEDSAQPLREFLLNECSGIWLQ